MFDQLLELITLLRRSDVWTGGCVAYWFCHACVVFFCV